MDHLCFYCGEPDEPEVRKIPHPECEQMVRQYVEYEQAIREQIKPWGLPA